MATTKTLQPTNQQITIAAFSGEKPDQRQIADAETKMADAINAVNSQISIKVGTNFTTVSDLESALNTLKDSLSDMNVRNVSFTCSTGMESPFTNASYGGVFIRNSSTRARIIVMRSGYDQILTGWLGNSGWTWQEVMTSRLTGLAEVTLTAGTNITINWQRCRRDYSGITNGLTVLEVTFTTGAAISSGATIMTGAPGIGGNMQFFTAVSDGGTIIPLGISGGTITTRTSIASGTKVRFIVSYFWMNT